MLVVAGRRADGAVLWRLAGAEDSFKFGFLTETIWNPVTDQFGALAPLYGTVITSLIAMLLAVPRGLRHRRVPDRDLPAVAARPDCHLHRAAGCGAQHRVRHLGPVRAGAGPAAHVQPWLIDVLGDLPVIGKLFRGPPFGIGLLTAGFVLAVMVLPFITSVMREVFLVDAALAEGSRLRSGRHAVGSHLGRGAAQLARRRRRRHHARDSGVRSARPWR